MQELSPVNSIEERVCFDLRRSLGTQSVLRSTIEQLYQKIFRGWRYDIGSWEMKRFGEDLAVHLIGVFVVVRRKTCQHLVEQYAESPPIYRLVVALTKKEFRRKVFRSSTER